MCPKHLALKYGTQINVCEYPWGRSCVPKAGAALLAECCSTNHLEWVPVGTCGSFITIMLINCVCGCNLMMWIPINRRLRHPPGEAWRSLLALHKVFVLWILPNPILEGFTGILLMAGVRVTHGQSHQSFQVVRLQF